MWYFLQKKHNLVLVTEFPKCGGTWFCNMLSDAIDVPFPRNISPKYQQNIMHGHNLFHPRMNKAICVMRDGRDVMVSAYFHFCFYGKDKSKRTTDLHRSKLKFDDYDQIKKNMPAFIEYLFTGFAQRNFTHFSWSDLVKNVLEYNDSVCVVKYEDLLVDPVSELEKAISFYNCKDPGKEKLKDIVEKYSFKNVTKRKQGQENRNSFVRKGISGDWKNHFTKEACEVFKKHGGQALIDMGYEKDLNWIND